MNIKISLPVFHHNEETRNLDDLGVEFKLSDTDTKEITFYHIDAIGPSIVPGDEQEYGNVYVGGNIFNINMSYADLKAEIERYRLR